jgi:splicing factor U2AF subunit
VHLAGPNQATRTQRRLYMGGLPSPCYDFQLVEFFNSTLLALGLVPPSGRPPVIKCDINAARGFAFVEFLEVADCTAALQLDGIIYNGAQINIKRPKDYAMPFGVSAAAAAAPCLMRSTPCRRVCCT